MVQSGDAWPMQENLSGKQQRVRLSGPAQYDAGFDQDYSGSNLSGRIKKRRYR
jgi:hypothetical protein